MDPEHRRENVATQRGTRLPVPKSRISHLGQNKNEVPILEPTTRPVPKSTLPIQSRSLLSNQRTFPSRPPSQSQRLPMGPPSTPSSRYGLKCDMKSINRWDESITASTAPEPRYVRSIVDTNVDVNGDTNAIARMDNKTANEESTDRSSREKRRPRPSLSDRTIETLSALSPSPARNARRSSVSSNHGARSPIRSASSLSTSRPGSPIRIRAVSPSKENASQLISSIPPVPRLSTVSNNSRLLKSPQVGVKTSTREPQKQSSLTRFGSPSRLVTPKSSRTSTTGSGTTEESSTPRASVSRTGLVKPNSMLKPTSTVKSQAKRGASGKGSAVSNAQDDHSSESPNQKSTIKSSSVLRETIAAAKAARRTAKPAVDQHGKPHVNKSNNLAEFDFDVIPELSARGLLQKRLEMAVTTGVLNISAMSFDQIPDQVLKMYDPGNVSTPWSEMVELVKLIAADNEMVHIQPDAFPDFTTQELEEDADKVNQFFGLQVLDVHNNLLTEIPLGWRRLEGLRMLNLSNNRLGNEALDIIRQVPNLVELHLAKNQFSKTFSLSEATSSTLRVLDLADNQLEGIETKSLPGLKALQILKMANNRIKVLPWADLSKLFLTEIDVSRNQLSGALIQASDVSFKSLRILDVSHNAIDSLAVHVDQAFPELQSLSANSNRLRSLPDLSDCHLHTLLLAENGLAAFPEWLSRIESLQRVDLGNNNLTTVDMTLATMDNLAYINLVGNPLRERKYLTMSTSELKADLEKRLTPDATDAEIHLMPDLVGSRPNSPNKSGAMAVNGILDLSSRNLNNISSTIVDSVATQTVHTMILARNQLSALPVELLMLPNIVSNLRSLDLSGNRNLMTEMSKGIRSEPINLAALTSLSLASTGLSNTTLSAFTEEHIHTPNLQTLNISNNNLTDSLSNLKLGFPKLRAVLAANNSLAILPASSVHGLEILDVRNNDIAHLPPDIGLLGNFPGGSHQENRLRLFECSGNKFRVPRLAIIEKGTEAILKDLRRMIPLNEVSEEWKEYL